MKHITKVLFVTLCAVVACAFMGVLQPQLVQASCTPSATQKCCGDTPITIDVGCDQNEAKSQGAIMAYIYAVIRFATGLVGAAIVGAIIFGGLVHMTARDNAAQIQKSIVIIRTAIIALILYIFSATLISFLIPGGLFSNL